jgi:hypothetical protein
MSNFTKICAAVLELLYADADTNKAKLRDAFFQLPVAYKPKMNPKDISHDP